MASIYLGGQGSTRAETAQALGISIEAVKKHLASIRRKFQTGIEPLSKLALRERLIAEGWLRDESDPA